MDFDIPAELDAYLKELDQFIENEIKPLENENDNIRFLIIVEKMLERTGSEAVCRPKIGRRCFSKREQGRIRLVIIALQCPKT